MSKSASGTSFTFSLPFPQRTGVFLLREVALCYTSIVLNNTKERTNPGVHNAAAVRKMFTMCTPDMLFPETWDDRSRAPAKGLA